MKKNFIAITLAVIGVVYSLWAIFYGLTNLNKSFEEQNHPIVIYLPTGHVEMVKNQFLQPGNSMEYKGKIILIKAVDSAGFYRMHPDSIVIQNTYSELSLCGFKNGEIFAGFLPCTPMLHTKIIQNIKIDKNKLTIQTFPHSISEMFWFVGLIEGIMVAIGLFWFPTSLLIKKIKEKNKNKKLTVPVLN